MSCQIGIYSDTDDAVDNWKSLIYLDDEQSPRDLLRELAPFLREFYGRRQTEDAEAMAAWLAWYLIDSSLVAPGSLNRIALSREVTSDVDFFLRVAPAQVEVFHIDDLLEWRLIASMDLALDQVEVESEQ